jgi:hypothetical protein
MLVLAIELVKDGMTLECATTSGSVRLESFKKTTQFFRKSNHSMEFITHRKGTKEIGKI